MKLWTRTDHAYHWPVGVASIVLAPLLTAELAKHGLAPPNVSPEHLFTLQEVDMAKEQAIVLHDGEY